MAQGLIFFPPHHHCEVCLCSFFFEQLFVCRHTAMAMKRTGLGCGHDGFPLAPMRIIFSFSFAGERGRVGAGSAAGGPRARPPSRLHRREGSLRPAKRGLVVHPCGERWQMETKQRKANNNVRQWQKPHIKKDHRRDASSSGPGPNPCLPLFRVVLQ